MANINQNYYRISNSTFLDQSILDVFVLQGLIDHQDADRLKQRLKTNRQIEDFLLGNHVVSKDTINKAYSIILKLPYVELKNVKIPDELKEIVTEKIARKFGIIAFSQDEGLVRIAVSRPADILTSFQSSLKDVFSKRKLEVELFITGETDLSEALRQYQKKDNPFLLKKGSLPVIYLRNQPIEDSYLKKFPAEFIAKYRLVVFGQNQRGHYLIACEAPDSPITIKILDFIKKENGVNIEQFATSSNDIDFVLQRIGGKVEKVEQTPDQKQKFQKSKSDSATGNVGNGEASGVIKGLLSSFLDNKGPQITIDEVNETDEMEVGENNANKEPADLTDKSGSETTELKNEKAGIQQEQPEVEKDKVETEKKTNDSEHNIGALLSEDITDVKKLEAVVKEESIPKIVAAVINYALLKKASDIHVEPENNTLRIRCRVDGILRDMINLPLKYHPPFVSRIKIISKLKIDESRIPQDGRFDVNFKDHSVDVRVSTLPTVHGEKIVMRILDKSQGVLSLEDLGMQGSAFEETNLAIGKPYGIILATGPTGSGKSTTLYAVLNRISLPGVNIVTLEDPVEYEIPGINQCQIKPEIGFTFASGLRSILRQDPNVIMVGEIRDAETASMATHAALTGHLVLSTLHTNDTAGALPRLINMGVEPFLITSSINLVIAQRLVRRICPKCREEVRMPQKLMDELKAEIAKIPVSNTKDRARIPQELRLYHGKGCNECTQGFRGRVGIYEVMAITPAIEELAIAKRPSNEIKETAIKEGMITMKQDGILKAFAGLTTVDEVFQAVINS